MSHWIMATVLVLSNMAWGLNNSFEISVLPVFSAKTIEGENIDYRVLSNGGVVTFFRSGCGYCLLEFPMWQKIRKTFPELMMILVTHNEANWRVSQFLIHHGNPFNYVIDDGHAVLWRMFGASQTPETFLINNHSEVIGHFGYLGKDSQVLLTNIKSGLET